jgi:AcrR family transcriptional regulator
MTAASIVAKAAEVVDRDGRNELTLGGLAAELGVQPSAFYNHLDGLDGLIHGLAIHSTNAVAESLRDAVVARSGAAAVRAIATAYREFAIAHPGQYAAQLLPPSGRADDLVAAQQRIVDLFVRVAESNGIVGDDAVHAARLIRSAVHGFVALEAIDALTSPVDPAESFDRLIDSLIGSLAVTSG